MRYLWLILVLCSSAIAQSDVRATVAKIVEDHRAWFRQSEIRYEDKIHFATPADKVGLKKQRDADRASFVVAHKADIDSLVKAGVLSKSPGNPKELMHMLRKWMATQ